MAIGVASWLQRIREILEPAGDTGRGKDDIEADSGGPSRGLPCAARFPGTWPQAYAGIVHWHGMNFVLNQLKEGHKHSSNEGEAPCTYEPV